MKPEVRVQGLIRSAKDLYSNGDFEEAIRKLSRAIVTLDNQRLLRVPENQQTCVNLLMNRALVQIAPGSHERAKEDYAQAIVYQDRYGLIRTHEGKQDRVRLLTGIADTLCELVLVLSTTEQSIQLPLT